MSNKKLKNIFIGILVFYTLFVVSFYFLSGEQLKYKESPNNMEIVEADSITDEINEKTSAIQSFTNTVDKIESMEIVFTKFYKDTAKGLVTIRLYDDDVVLFRETINIKDIPEQHRVTLYPDAKAENLKNKRLSLEITSNAKVGQGVGVMMRKEDATATSFVKVGNNNINATLCFALKGVDIIPASDYYWAITGGVGLLLAGLLFTSYRQYIKGHINYLVLALLAIERYKYLISQLVIRDFKSKYKRSVFGVFWSFLNPLLTMTVQFLVFSTFFKADTKNYPVYLLCGVVCFSFFSECTSMCLTSISGNSRLITKVYIPKYIFPLSRTISSAVNLAISLVPLFLACLVLGIVIRPQALLFFYFLACLVVFSLGVGMFLSALMVFFRDIQFLWTVLIQIWNYATPIFYPAEIVPDKYIFILRFNPLYHFIGNARKCLMDGISPEPMAYINCFLFAFGSLLIGAYVFKKTQDKFALYV